MVSHTQHARTYGRPRQLRLQLFGGNVKEVANTYIRRVPVSVDERIVHATSCRVVSCDGPGDDRRTHAELRTCRQ
jgi:hypothetical protein